MAQEYIPNRDADYSSKSEFLTGEGIPEEFWTYFDEYDPTSEELIQEEFDLDTRKARFEIGQQKRALLSQASKSGFATHGAIEQAPKDLMSMFADQQTLAESQRGADIEVAQDDWLNSQFDIAASMASDIVQAKKSVGTLINDINADDPHWERDNLKRYDDTPKERKFIKWMEQEGSSEWDGWMKPKWNSYKELQRSHAKRGDWPQVTSLSDPGT